MTQSMHEFDFELFEAEFARTNTVVARKSRVWRAPSTDHNPGRRSRLAAMAATAAVIAGGAVAVVAVTPGSPQAIDVPESAGSMYHVVDQVGARQLWERGITGAGVNVAIIDTGVADVAALSGPGKIRAAVDLSSERHDAERAFVDTYGHGTHLAGIIAGRTPGAVPAHADQHPEWFMGVAPDAGLVPVKVAGRDGTVSPAQMVTAVDWVVDHAEQLDIGVLTIAFDAGASSYADDPLAAALERAWQAGIVVVSAAGNEGAGSAALGSPANAPFVIAAGGVEFGADGASVPEWTSAGDGVRNPDVAAPGAHIESLRAPGSSADVDHPEGRVDEQHFLGSGSSQSAAVTAGVVALVRSARPQLTPDQVKQVLIDSASPVAGDVSRVGSGVIDAVAALATPATTHTQTWEPITAAPVDRVAGVATIAASGDLTSSSWASSSWASSSWASSSWASSSWASSSWASSSWASSSWASSSWASSSWA
jgi:serine protease AprX